MSLSLINSESISENHTFKSEFKYESLIKNHSVFLYSTITTQKKECAGLKVNQTTDQTKNLKMNFKTMPKTEIKIGLRSVITLKFTQKKQWSFGLGGCIIIMNESIMNESIMNESIMNESDLEINKEIV